MGDQNDEREQSRLDRAFEIFGEIAELPADRRMVALRERCAEDSSLYDQVAALLDKDDQLRFGAPTAAAIDPACASTVARGRFAAGERIGPYSIKSVIASGGMGTVYLAMQEQPRRRVALKVMNRGVASKSALRRFEYESQILARLRHPNIAQVFEAGTHDDGEGGVPYFAMEYVPNARPITDYAREKKLGTRDRLALFAKVCDAIHHGHQKGIIHRDLKPSNILVDSDGEPKIIDFGVARSTDSDMAITTLQTDIGQLVGTLQYMSPEQCDADPLALDTRSDVYALGVVLYELLTEQLPYDLARVAMFEAARVIKEDAPARPSSFNRAVRGDIETITLKALEKDRARRYQSASDLGQDIERYLTDEPIDARPPSATYRLRKYVQRNRVGVIAAGVVGAGLLISTAVSIRFALSETTQRGIAETKTQEATTAGEAEKAAKEVAQQRAEELQARTEELETVTEFQASMLSGIDADQMGRGIIADQRNQVRERLENDGATTEEIEVALVVPATNDAT